jgi:hypothetical protein
MAAPRAQQKTADIGSGGVVLYVWDDDEEDFVALTSEAFGDFTGLSESVDGLEALATTLNGLITTLDGHVDQLEGYTDTVEAKLTGPTTGTQSSVGDAASDTTILASNANRKGALVYNDSAADLYLLLASGTSSTSNFSVLVGAYKSYELPVCQGGVYTGIIKGIWASDAGGNARVTELT